MVREMATQAIERATGGIAAMRIVAVGVTPELPGAAMRSTIDVEMLGCDLRPGIDRVVEQDIGRLEEKLTKLVDLHLVRRKALAEARVAEATGWIDGAARLILREAGLDLAEMVRRLAAESEVEFYFGGEEGYDLTGAVYWVDGTIKAFVEDRTRGAIFRLQTDQLTIEMPNIPATVIASLTGRRLRDVIDLRFIPETAIIVDVQESGVWLYLDLEIGRSTIEAAIAQS
jgi:hypothetical protein